MASYTEAQVITQLKNAIKPFETVRLTCESSSPNVLGLEDTLTQSLHSDYADQIASSWGSARSRLNDYLGSIGGVLSPIWRTWAQVLTTSPDFAPDSSDQAIISRVYDRMLTSGDRVTSRGFTFGAGTVSGTGNGTLKRLTQDERNLPIENVYPEKKVAWCTLDQNSGTNKHSEQFEVRGQKSFKDLLSITGSGLVQSITAKCAQDSILTNASFDQYDSATAPTTINGWTATTNITNFAIDTTNYYRGFGADDSTTHQSLKIKANDSLYQTKANFQRQLAAGVPVYAQLAYNRAVNSCNDGTLTFYLGSQSTSVVLAAQAGWNVLAFTINSTNCWLRNFNQNDLTVKVGLSGSTTFNVLVDDALVVFFDYADGWYCVVGGTTPFLRNDQIAWTDTAVECTLQKWIWRGTARYLPAALPAPTAAAPTVALSATAGSVTTGTHVVAVTFLDAAGNESAPGTSSGTVTGNGTKNVDVTVIPLGPANVTSRKLYMSKAGTATPLYYAGVTISDNTTTTATGASGITVADASLTVLAPTGVTISEP